MALTLRLGLVADDDDFRRFWASRGVSALGQFDVRDFGAIPMLP